MGRRMELRHLRYFVAVSEATIGEADAVGLDARRRRGLVGMTHHGRALLSGYHVEYERQGCSRAIDVVLHRGRPAHSDRPDNFSVDLDGKPSTPRRHTGKRGHAGQERRVALDKVEKVLRGDAEQSRVRLVLRNLDAKDRGPIHPAKGLEIAAVIEDRHVLGNADFSGFRHRFFHHFLCQFGRNAVFLHHVSHWTASTDMYRALIGNCAQPAVLPPSTVRICPVMNDAFSEARKTAARAMSAGSPTRPSGTVFTSAAFLSTVPVKRLSRAVSTGPGATALMRTPELAASSAADFVMPSTACLLAT